MYDEKKEIADFEAVKLKLASPERILEWSFGEVTKPETINYRTQKPEKEGLFDERIFGPTKDWECYCGKYRRIRYKGIVCDKCGVEVTRSIVRRERMAHIKLATPVSHIWFLRGVPSKMGLLLDINVGQLEKVVYSASYIVMEVDEDAKKEVLNRLQSEGESKKAAVKKGYKQLRDGLDKNKGGKKREKLIRQEKEELEKLAAAISEAQARLKNLEAHSIITEVEYRDLSLKYGHVFKAGIGPEAIRKIFETIDLQKLEKELTSELEEASVAKRKRVNRRVSLIRSLIKAEIRPEWMFLTVLPVIPPDLRPMVQLDGGRFAASDLNDLYRRVINRNNRLRRLLELGAPEVITRNEKRMLQEAVDALIDNSARRGSTTTSIMGQRRQLKSMADMLKGKQGRFRQNLLGKRVDYSGRSVIVIGPDLKLHQCGLPKVMALELFKPFVIHQLIKRELAHNIRSATRLIEQAVPEVWDALEEVTKSRKVLLNRAPTLHRLGIQAFQPVLIEGKAIQIHPMVTTPFNADFDGDQMAVHVPLSDKACYEADELMLSSHNLLKPSDGMPATSATQDIVFGIFYITEFVEGAAGEGKAFADINEAVVAYEEGRVAVNARIKVFHPTRRSEIVETTVGRLLFYEIMPEGSEFINDVFDKAHLKRVIGDVLSEHGQAVVAEFLDKMKSLGFIFATKSGLSWGMNDLTVPHEKGHILEEADAKVGLIGKQYEEGLLTDEERYRMTVSVWEEAREEMGGLAQRTLDEKGTVFAMVNSGARGSWTQVMQMMGMKGTVSGPTGEVVEVPIKSSFKEGFTVLEYFLSTHGTRKGMADTALRTATAGYLTRRLVNVAQDVITHEDDCGEERGEIITLADSEEIGTTLGARVMGRVLAELVRHPKSKKVLFKRGTLLGREESAVIDKLGIKEVAVRSVVACQAKRGICRVCYGWDLGRREMVKLGEPVGVVAAQAIGEPGTQLTMRTFHSGGVGSEDITQGLPRVEELFEARMPKGEAVMSEIDGAVDIKRDKQELRIIVTSTGSKVKKYNWQGGVLAKEIKSGNKVEEKDALFVDIHGEKIAAPFAGVATVQENELTVRGRGKDVREYAMPLNTTLNVREGETVMAGQQLTEGHLNVHALYEVAGVKVVQQYVLREVQRVYAIQGEMINDKHLEIMVRQMLSRVRVNDSGETELVSGRIVELGEFVLENEKAEKEKRKPAIGEQLLLGITKVSLTTRSFLAAASFMETARVMIDAAVTGRSDALEGLKENVIIGRLIPVGTGYEHSRIAETVETEKS